MMKQEVKVQTPRKYLRDAALWSAGINLVLNLLAGWLFYMKVPSLPLRGEQSVNGDAAVMTFLIVFCSLLLSVPGIRKMVTNGQLLRIPDARPLPRPFRWLLQNGLVLALVLAFLCVFTFVPLAVWLLGRLGVESLSLGWFLVFKSAYAALLAGTVIPLVDWLVLLNESGKPRLPGYRTTLEALKQHPLPDWFQDAKFGIMVHWSLSSVPGWATPVGSLHEVTKEKGFAYWFSHNPYAEWYWNTLKIPGSPTQEYHAATFGADFPYPDFKEKFNAAAAKWDPASWAELFAAAGARYVVMVTKHHDGFQLWPSRVPHPHRPGFHAERDLVGELAAAVRARGLRMGLYYSGGPDWLFETRPVADVVDMADDIPQTPDYVAYVDAQWRELIERYRPSVLWNDIGFPAKLDVRRLYADYYNAIPDGVINDRCLQADVRRLAASRPGRAVLKFLIERMLHASGKGGIPKRIHADFTTPEYTSLAQIAGYKWETVRGLGYSFGYNRNETAGHMLSVEQLVHMLADIVSKNGNLLLNVGPMADGTIPPLQRERVEGLGRWLTANGEAIYGTRPWRTAEGQTGDGLPVRFTQKDGSLYAILLGTPAATELRFPGLRFEHGTAAALLGSPTPLTVDAATSTVRLVAPLPASPAHVVKLSPLPEPGH